MEKTCENCKHFRLHYIKYPKGHYYPLLYGHCVTPRVKDRYAKTKACEHWQEKENPKV